VIWGLSDPLAGRLAPQDAGLRDQCVWCIRLASVLTAIRAIETVCISTQKAFERYGAAVGISVAGRLLSLAATAILAIRSQSIATIMLVTAALTAVSLGMQLIGLQRLLGIRNIRPAYEGPVSLDLLRFGAFTWILAATGVVFSQADRLIGGASLGAAAIVSYALCAQLSQPVYGLTAAGLHFLFPYIAARQADAHRTDFRRTLLFALLANVGMVLTGVALLLACSQPLLRALASDELAQSSALLLPSVLAGSALLALNVTGSYAMVALGQVRTVSILNLAACAVVAAFMIGSIRSLGVTALASGRIAFALIALCIYIPLTKELRWRKEQIEQFTSSEAVEGV
jgi:O-antigen/teichoic acid export membrane protein